MVKIGMLIGDRYEIVEKIGTGGMSDVYKSKDHKLNRFVAVKVLKQEFSENTSFVGKFRIEAQAAAGLMHPNIVNVYDVGEENGIYYIVMELVEGITLKRYIEKKARLSVREATSIAIQIAMGIESAHNNHIIHRDIKPQNIIISKDGKVKITDFGIAKAATSNTITSNVMGSVHYTSPEQARGGYSDEKSDVYSLGITLFEMLTGRVPFNGETTVAIAIKHIQEEMPSPKDYVPEIPVSIEQIVFKCTMKSPDRRYQNMAELVEDLKHSLRNPDEDFVKLDSFDKTGETKAISGSDLESIKRKRAQMAETDEETGRRRPPAMKGTEQESSNGREVRQQPAKTNRTQSVKKNPAVDEKKKNNSKQLDKVMMGITIGLAVAIGVLIIVLIGNAIGVIGSGSKEENVLESVTIPAVLGKDYSEVEMQLKSLGLDVSKEFVESSTVAENMIISASVTEGDIVVRGSTVKLTISSGTEGVSVPSVVGVSLAEAKSTLGKEGFEVITVEAFSTEVSKNNVISQTPEANSKVPRGTEITLTISAGEEELYSKMPKIVGLTEEQARAALVENGFKMCYVSMHSNDYPVGYVCKQDFPEGEEVKQGTTMNLYVSSGPEESDTSVSAGTGSYSYVGEISQPNSVEYVAGTNVTITVVGADGAQLWKTSSSSFPVAVNIHGIAAAYGTTYLEYTVTGASTTTTDPETGAQVTTPGGTETRTEERTVYFVEQ